MRDEAAPHLSLEGRELLIACKSSLGACRDGKGAIAEAPEDPEEALVAYAIGAEVSPPPHALSHPLI